MSARLRGGQGGATPPDLGSGDNALGHARELRSDRVTGLAAAIVEQLPPFGWARVLINTVAIAVCAHDHLKRIQLFLRTRVPRFPRGETELKVRRRGRHQLRETGSLLNWREIRETLDCLGRCVWRHNTLARQRSCKRDGPVTDNTT